jgi:hypothetical protein
VAEELLEGDGTEGHGVEVREVLVRRFHQPVQLLQERGGRRLCGTRRRE